MSSLTVNKDYQTDHVPWSAWTRRLIGVIVIIAVIIGLLLAGPIYGQVVAALVLCLFLFVPLRAIMHWTRLSYMLSPLLTFIGYLLISVVLIVLLTAPLLDLVANLLSNAEHSLNDVNVYLQEYTPGNAVVYDSAGNFLFDLDAILLPLSQNVKANEAAQTSASLPNLLQIVTNSLGAVFGFGGNLFGFIYNLIFVNILALFFLVELPNFYTWIMRSLSAPTKRQIGVLLARFNSTWTGYLRGAVIISAIGAAFTWTLLWLLGIPNAVGITFLTTIALLIPLFGPVIGSITCFVAALISGSTTLDLAPLGVAIVAAGQFFFIRGFLVGNLIYPRVVGKSVGVPGVIVLVAIPFFGALGGILGMFLSPTLAAILFHVGAYIHAKMNGREPFPDDPTPQFMFTNMLHPRRIAVGTSNDQAG